MRQISLALMMVFSAATILLCVDAQAVQIAFLEVVQANGEQIELEPGGRFAHIAIRVQTGWMHAHPKTGVEITKELSKFGRVIVILENAAVGMPSEEWIRDRLGQRYDWSFDWTDQSSTYCSKLVGQYLMIPPRKMSFSGASWKSRLKNFIAQHLGGNEPLGLSPDDIYEALVANPDWRFALPRGAPTTFDCGDLLDIKGL